MSLVRTSKEPTRFVLTVSVPTNQGFVKINRYYYCESDLFKAYYQLKRINGNIKPLYPVVYD